jgi:hypothetical protein
VSPGLVCSVAAKKKARGGNMVSPALSGEGGI